MQCPLSVADVALPCGTMARIQPLALAKHSQEATHSTPCGLEPPEGLHPSSEHGELPTHLNPRTQIGRTLRTSGGGCFRRAETVRSGTCGRFFQIPEPGELFPCARGYGAHATPSAAPAPASPDTKPLTLGTRGGTADPPSRSQTLD